MALTVGTQENSDLKQGSFTHHLLSPYYMPDIRLGAGEHSSEQHRQVLNLYEHSPVCGENIILWNIGVPTLHGSAES